MSDTLPLFVGLDYHQQAVQVCVLDAQGRQLLNRPLDNDSRAIAAAVAQLGTVQRAASRVAAAPPTWRRNWRISVAGRSTWRIRDT